MHFSLLLMFVKFVFLITCFGAYFETFFKVEFLVPPYDVTCSHHPSP
jgi:hypothetical protein